MKGRFTCNTFSLCLFNIFLEPRFDHYLSLLATKGVVSCNLSELTLADNETYSILHADVVENVDDDVGL